MSETPRLRPVEVIPVQQQDEILFYLKDPMHFSAPLALTLPGYFILSHFDGEHSLTDVQAAYCRRFGDLLLSEEIKRLIHLLDEHHYLENERFREHRGKIIEDFRRLPTRPPAHAATVYKEDAEALMAQLEGYFQHSDGPGLPSAKSTRTIPRAIVAPHIDFRRGGPCYAWAYKRLAEASNADLFIILGTVHCSGQNPFICTLKDFETPLGRVETDKEFIHELQGRYAGDLFADEYLHRAEHSLEFQIVFLKYLARRAESMGREKPFKIVPILVSSFHRMIERRTLPEKDPKVGEFFKALNGLIKAERRSVCMVAGVDLAHVGRQFGDREPITPEFLKWVEEEDGRLIEKLVYPDAPGFFHEIAKDNDRRRVCGFSPLYSLIHLLNGAKGKCLKYAQAFTPETGSAVTFTGIVFD